MKKRKESQFSEYLAHLTDIEKDAVVAFFKNFKQHISLPLGEERKMRVDLETALMYYGSVGVSVEEALRRLSNDNLGGFYARPPTLYYELDDAAKIYPLNMRYGFMSVFRLAVNLKDDVVPALLQIALTFTIKRFPRFATTLKKGFFWHFLDSNKQRYGIEEEEHVPCRPLIVANTASKSFRVLYYKTRISIEFFHSLTDGRGGLYFLQTLTQTYLSLTGADKVVHPSVLDIGEAPRAEENANEFKRSKSTKASGFREKPALQMTGKVSANKPTQMLHFRLDVSELKAVTKKYGVSVTTYFTAIILLACKFATEAKSGDLSVQIPVNMRQYYPSETLSNFALYTGIRFDINAIPSLKDFLPMVEEQLRTKTTFEKMSEMMYSTHKMNRDVRFFPLFLKNPIAKFAYGLLGEKVFTTTFSNLGQVSAPPNFSEYVDSYDFALGPPVTNRAYNALISYNDIATFSITKVTRDPSYEEEIYRLLCQDGLTITVEGSALYESKRRISRKKH